MEGHICRQNTLMFALVFCFELRARAARTCCHCHLAVKNPIHDCNQGQLKLPKSQERYHNVVMWHWIVYKWRRSKQRLSFHRTFFNLLVFTVSLSCRNCHSETPWSHSSHQPGGTYYQALDFSLRTNYWKCYAWMQNWQIKPPPAMWKHLSFECLGVIVVALNGKSASMLLESTKNKLKQWLVIEKSVNNCNFFQIFWTYYNMNENNRKTDLWRSNSYI